MTPEQFDAFWTPARLAALDAAAEPWMADEATYAAWTRTHPAPTLATACGLAVQVGLVTEGLRHYQARAQAAEGALAALERVRVAAVALWEKDAQEPREEYATVWEWVELINALEAAEGQA